MLNSAVSGPQQWVTVLVMQQNEYPPSQNRTQTSHQSSRDQCIGVHRLAMAIDVVGGALAKGFRRCWEPEMSRPRSKRIGQGFSLIRLGHQGEQSLRVEIAVGPFPTTEQRERIASVAAQIPSPMEPNDPEKQQGQHQHPARVA